VGVLPFEHRVIACGYTYNTVVYEFRYLGICRTTMNLHTLTLLLCCGLLSTSAAPAWGQGESPAPEFTPRVMIAYSAYQPRPRHPAVYFYHHDGVSQGKVVGSITPTGKRSDYHATLSSDGRWCAFAAEVENNTSKVLLWDVEKAALVELPDSNDTPHAQLYAALSGDGKLIAYSAWSHPQGVGRWDVLVYDVIGKRRLPLGGLNTNEFDERMPSIDAHGRLMAFTSNAKTGKGLSDIYVYDFETADAEHDPQLNTPYRETEPSLSADGRLVAFSSDRPGGEGGRDIYLYDRLKREYLPLPGLNYVSHEQSPKLSPDGRYLVFVSERLAGQGERDVFLYDRQTAKLLPTPGLNGAHEDIDPCVIVLPRK